VGFRFRRSVRVLPGIRLNLSKSGASVSLGGRGFHYTIGSKGTRTTVGLPGTGLFWTEYRRRGGGAGTRVRQHNSSASNVSAINPIATRRVEEASALVPIESRAGNEINALSTSALAPLLNKTHRRFRLSVPTLIGSFSLFLLATNSAVQELVGVAALYLSVFVPISIFIDRYRRSIWLDLKLNRTAQTVMDVLLESISQLKTCAAIWSVRAQAYTSDWKRNAGATTLSHRDRIRPEISRPSCIRGNAKFPTIKLGGAELFFLPDSILVTSKRSVAALNYCDLLFSCSGTSFIETGRIPGDATIVGYTWRFVNKSGGPDRRFNFNRQLPICRYGEMNFASAGGLDGKMQYSNVSAGEKFARALEILIKHAASGEELKPIASYSTPKKWPTIVFLSCALLFGAGLALTELLTWPKVGDASSGASQSVGANVNSLAMQRSAGLRGRVSVPEGRVQHKRPVPTAPLDILPPSGVAPPGPAGPIGLPERSGIH